MMLTMCPVIRAPSASKLVRNNASLHEDNLSGQVGTRQGRPHRLVIEMQLWTPASRMDDTSLRATDFAPRDIVKINIKLVISKSSSNTTVVRPRAGRGRMPVGYLPPPFPLTAASASAISLANGIANDTAASSTSEVYVQDELDGCRGLVLDTTYRPINVVCWKRALCLEILEKADVLQYYDQVVKSPNKTWPIPAVLRISNFVHTPKDKKRKLSLSRNNIFLRDKFQCQYCSSRNDLTIDHVKAVSRGGGSSWENLVTACAPCNLKKGDKNPQEAGMKLLKKPRVWSLDRSSEKHKASTRSPKIPFYLVPTLAAACIIMAKESFDRSRRSSTCETSLPTTRRTAA